MSLKTPCRRAWKMCASAVILGLTACGGEGGGPSGPPPPPATGTIEVSVATSGTDLDVDRFNVKVGTRSQASELNATIDFDVVAGSHSVDLEDLAGNCSVAGGLPVGATVSAGQTATVSLTITCSAIPPLVDKIVYACSGPGNGISIWAADVAGGTPVALTGDLRPDRARESEVAISPDGKRIALSRAEDGVAQLVIVNADGGDEWVLAEDQILQGISWSPDGTKLLFHTAPPLSGILVADMDGRSPAAPLAMDVRSGDRNPQWSPDGAKIVFQSDRNGGTWGDLYVMNADGTGITQLTFTGAELYQPYWSPDGTRIAFSSLRNATGNALDFGNDEADVYVMDADGGNVTRLTNADDHDRGGAWSPDGTRLAIVSDRGSAGLAVDDRIYTMDPDGGNVVQVTTDACSSTGVGGDPVWGPSS